MKRKRLLWGLSLCMVLLFGKVEAAATELNTNKDSKQENRSGMEDVFYGNNVRVGWFECEGYFEKDKNDNLIGFGVDYLNALASYTGWKYQFVQSTREGCLKMLQDGDIDLMSPVSVDLQLNNAKVSEEIIGESYGYIYKSGNNFKVSYEEYSKFNHMMIGMEKGSHMEEKVQEYCEKNGFTFFDIKYFDTLDEMQSALAGKKIDVFVTDSYANVENLKVIGRFSNGCIAFGVSNKALWEELNLAMEKMKLDNPDYTEDLRKRYFSENSQNNLEYSVEEREFLSKGRTYEVALSTDQYPISYKATKESGHKGIAVDILKKLEYYSDIQFKIIYVESYEKGQEMLGKGEVDILGGSIIGKQQMENTAYTYVQNSPNRRRQYTVDFYDMDMVFIGRKGTAMENSLKVALPPYMEQCMEDLESLYPKYNFVVYESDEKALSAILNKQADVAVQSNLKMNELMIYDKYKELQNLKFLMGKYSVAFTVWTDEPELVNIMNKTLKGISEKTISTIENNNIQHIAMEQMTPLEFIYRYRAYFIFSGILLITINIAGFGYRKYKEEQRSKEKAYRDSVAKIGSMEKFRVDVEPILKSERKLDYYMIAVDVDRFKVINDMFGFEEGDRVIAYLAKVLHSYAGEESYVARPNADYFVVLKKAEQLSEAEEYLKKVFAVVEKDIAEHNIEYRLILKAGIYKVTQEDHVLSAIMDKADLAKNKMEVGHQSCYALYSEEMRQKTIEDKKLENDMDHALKNDEFKVYLQPQVDLNTKRIVSAEVLVRWVHSERGMIPSGKFIPLFEKNGFIRKLDMYVWEESIKALARWRDTGRIMVPLSINLSRVDIQDMGIVTFLKNLLDKYQISTKWIKAELTESICLENDTIIVEKMNELKKYGFTIAIDDFGSGYSSLHLLKKMPADIMKIDKSFLDYDENMNENDEIVIRDVVELGKHLKMQIVVEGVETLEQSDFLQAMGCDIAQGYYYGKPMPLSEFEELLDKNYGLEEGEYET